MPESTVSEREAPARFSLSGSPGAASISEKALEINISGAVKLPGTVRLPFLARLSSAIEVAQGIPVRNFVVP